MDWNKVWDEEHVQGVKIWESGNSITFRDINDKIELF